MKQLLTFLIFSLLVACTDTPTPQNTESKEKLSDTNKPKQTTKQESIAIDDAHPLMGTYVGMFEATVFNEEKDPSMVNKITISLDSLKEGSILGHSVVAGNSRPFKGTFVESDASFEAKVKEPGNDRYDGTFSFSISKPTGVMDGEWIANNQKLAVPKRKYSLEKRDFVYNASFTVPEMEYDILVESDLFGEEGEVVSADASKYNASEFVLSKKHVENMYGTDLEIMRNAIYARHGYSFKNRKMRYFFDRFVEWYMPISTDIRSELSPLEKKNIDLIKRYEEHAERYYDSFGR